MSKDELLAIVKELMFREMAQVHLIEREGGLYWGLTEKGFEWTHALMRLLPRDDGTFEEVLKNARTWDVKPGYEYPIWDANGDLAAFIKRSVPEEPGDDHFVRYRVGGAFIDCPDAFTHAEFRHLESMLSQYPAPATDAQWAEFLAALMRGVGAAADLLESFERRKSK